MARFEVKFRNVVRERAGGIEKLYYREGQGRRVRLRAEPGTEAFRLEYEAVALAYAQTPTTASLTAAPGSLRAWCERYFGTTHFKALDTETRRVRRRILEAIWLEPIAPGSPRLMGDCPIGKFTREHVQVLVDRKAETPEAAKGRLKALRPVMKLALLEKAMAANPCADIALVHRATEGHHTWTVDEIRQFEAKHPAGSKARLAMRIIRCAGLRISDVSRFGRQHCRDGWIRLPIYKNRASKPKVLEMPILPELQEELDCATSKGLTWLETEYGKAFSIKGLGQKMKTWCIEAGLPHCSAHGIRKAAASIAAENGATESQLMSIFTWDDPKMAAHYTKKARARKLSESALSLLKRGAGEEQNPAEIPRGKTARGI